MAKWRIEDSADLYNIKGWGVDYFRINSNGNVEVTPRKNLAHVDLKDLVDDLQMQDVGTPILVRFPDIIGDRIETLHKSFKKAAKEYDFKGSYHSVYPIKVNQAKPIVEEIAGLGNKFNVGLEAGSKPELHAVLAFTGNDEGIIVCNGYKDEKFIELALLAQKMGRTIFIVVEKLNEMKLIARLAEKHSVKPNIGIRVKLSSEGSGKWEDSAGEKSKFGLNASELLEAVELAKEHNFLDRIKLVHYHIGSQVTNIRKIKNALREAAQFYVQLRKLGCMIEYVDVGGGLGIDYDGSRTSAQSSINYFIQEYMNDIVATLVEAGDKNDEPHPNIITESGRAITAHHSILIFDVLETTSIPAWDNSEKINEDEHELVLELYEIFQNVSVKRMLESWHDAQQIRDEALDLFSLGLLGLPTRAIIERLFWSIAREVYLISFEVKHQPEELRKLTKMLADKYFCNFSLFQSLPDSWAIDQIFPIIPIHRLNEQPQRLATLQDITCDSDGKIANFIGEREFSFTLPVHKLNNGEPYYLAVFLVGAYQEILGDMHNLFGDTNTVHVTVDEEGYKIDQVIDGETVSEVLSYVFYNSKKMVRTIEAWVTKSVKSGKISAEEGKEFLSNYRSGLYGYTYLD